MDPVEFAKQMGIIQQQMKHQDTSSVVYAELKLQAVSLAVTALRSKDLSEGATIFADIMKVFA